MQTAVAGVNHNEQHLLSCVCVCGGGATALTLYFVVFSTFFQLFLQNFTYFCIFTSLTWLTDHSLMRRMCLQPPHCRSHKCRYLFGKALVGKYDLQVKCRFSLFASQLVKC